MPKTTSTVLPRPAVGARPSARRVLTSAVLATLAAVLPASVAQAQYRIQNNDGSILDANNRLGSDGTYRGTVNRNLYNALDPNDIITGNVSGGLHFRGNVPYRDAREFRGYISRPSDRFLREASGVTTGGQVINNANVARPYFSTSRTVAPPPGYVTVPGSTAYIPPRTLPNARLSDTDYLVDQGVRVDSRIDLNISGDRQDAAIDNDQPYSNYATDPGLDDNPPSAYDAGARVGPYGDSQNVTTGAALLRPLSARDLTGNVQLSPYTSLRQNERLIGIDDAVINSLRSDLLRDAEGNPVSPDALTNALNPGRVEANVGSPQTAPGGQGQLSAGQRVDARTGAGQPLGTRDPLADFERNLRIVGPEQQSEQYARLVERLERFEQDPFAAQLEDVLRPAEDVTAGADQPLIPGLPMPQGNAGGAGQAQADQGRAQEEPVVPQGMFDTPGEATPAPGRAQAGQAQTPNQGNRPVQIESLTTGIRSRPLEQIYEEAETALREGKYVTAITRYDAAERLVPNQPMTLVGRGVAEMGAGYYRRAQESLRRAYEGDRALAMAQYDLLNLLGRERLEEVAEELRQTANENKQDPGPVFLLAFIDYNTGNERRAAAYLELADERARQQAGQPDPFYRTLQTYWGLAGSREEGATAQPSTRPASPAQQSAPEADFNK